MYTHVTNTYFHIRTYSETKYIHVFTCTFFSPHISEALLTFVIVCVDVDTFDTKKLSLYIQDILHNKSNLLMYPKVLLFHAHCICAYDS